MTIRPTITETVALVKQEILEGILDGTFPVTVSTYSELHDYCDANCLGGMCDEVFWAAFPTSTSVMDHANRVQNQVDEWLRAGRPGHVAFFDGPEEVALVFDVLDFQDDDAELSENSGADFDVIDNTRASVMALVRAAREAAR